MAERTPAQMTGSPSDFARITSRMCICERPSVADTRSRIVLLDSGASTEGPLADTPARYMERGAL